MNLTSTTHSPTASQTGFSLVEVLVALVVLSIGLIGLASIQQAGARNGHNALLRSQGSFLAYEIADHMRSNIAGVRLGKYNASSAPANDPQCATTDSLAAIICTPTQVAEYQLNRWYDNIDNELPQGTGASTIGCIDADNSDISPCSKGSVVNISVRWAESSITGTEELTFRTQIQL